MQRNRNGGDGRSPGTTLRATVAITVLLLAGNGARAQIDNGLPGPQPFDVGGFVMNQMLLENALYNGRKSASKTKTPKPAAATAVTTYKATPGVSAKVRKRYLDWLAGRSETEAETLRTAFAKQDPIQLWSQIVRGDGLKTGDVTDAFTAYWLLNWMIATRGDGTREKVQAVRAQVRPTLLSNPAYVRLTEAQRQEMAEIWMLNFIVQHGVYSAAVQRNDTALLAKLSAAAVARFKNEMGVDLRDLDLTEKGFVKKN